MRPIPLASLAAVAALLAWPPPARAQQTPMVARPGNEIGTGQSLPLSNDASNMTAEDTRSAIAPRLPEPPVADDAPPAGFLKVPDGRCSPGTRGWRRKQWSGPKAAR